MESAELVFVHLGDSLPTYVKPAIALAAENGGLPCRLLASRKHLLRLKSLDCKFSALEDFYDATQFTSAALSSLSSSTFRRGFWQKSLERFFVLEQFMSAFDVEGLVHAELDQAVFRCDLLFEEIRKVDSSGMFFPFHGEDNGLGSLVVITRRAVLSEFVKFSSSGLLYWNEMQLLALFEKFSGGAVTALPTVVNWLRQDQGDVPDIPTLSHYASHGIADAAQLGQWVGGIDPQNLPITEVPQTKFVDTPSKYLVTATELASLEFKYLPQTHELFIQTGFEGQAVRLYNLHFHSKIHLTLSKFRGGLSGFFQKANGPDSVRFREARLRQIIGFLSGYFRVIVRSPGFAASTLITLIRRKLGWKPTPGKLLSISTLLEKGRSSLESFFRKRGVGVRYVLPSELSRLQAQLQQIENLSEKPALLVDFKGASPSQEELDALRWLAKNRTVLALSANFEVPEGVSRIPRGHTSLANAPLKYLKHLEKAKRASRLFAFAWSFQPNQHDGTIQLAQRLHDSGISRGLINMRKTDFIEALGSCAAHVFSAEQSTNEELIWESMVAGCVPVLQPSWISEFYLEAGFPVLVSDDIGGLMDSSVSDLLDLQKRMHSETQEGIFEIDYWLRELDLAHLNTGETESAS